MIHDLSWQPWSNDDAEADLAGTRSGGGRDDDDGGDDGDDDDDENGGGGKAGHAGKSGDPGYIMLLSASADGIAKVQKRTRGVRVCMVCVCVCSSTQSAVLCLWYNLHYVCLVVLLRFWF